jgi:hypothetical protein
MELVLTSSGVSPALTMAINSATWSDVSESVGCARARDALSPSTVIFSSAKMSLQVPAYRQVM